MPPVLRPYQSRAINELRQLLLAGKRRMLLVSPTGSGKTVVFAEIIRSFRERRDGSALVIVHRRELADQALAKLAAVGVEAGLIMGDDKRADATRKVQVASIQTLHRRIEHLPPAGLVIYDEAQHSSSPSSRAVLDRYPEALVIGATATPWRSDKFGLGDVYEASVVAATPAELIGLGALVPAECYCYDAPDIHEVPVLAGDYSQAALGIACNTSVLVGNIVREYVTHASGKRAIVFPVDCQHSKALVAQFEAAGVPARHIDWSTPPAERAAAIEAFRSGSVLALASVGVLTEGFDVPAAEVCILARPTKSLGLYLQMVGRILRPAQGKSVALVHDHGGTLFRLGFPEDPRDYSLTATSQRVRDLQSCTDCNFLVARWPADGHCPKCGSLQHLPAEQRAAVEKRRGKEVVEGVRLDRAAIEKLRAKFAALGRQLTRAQAEKLAAATKLDRAAEYLRLLGVAQRKGFDEGWARHAYQETFGKWPRFSDEDLAGLVPADRPFLPLPPRARAPEAA